ncbi:hypothetical protein EO95_18445 [Methanosarcina sp. 1.H.T.1A.1]|nr:hypothetical protein EO95_18445 [Methanosarcina sp. 1.H.T.1A.1]
MPRGLKKISSLIPTRLLFNLQVNPSASASLSGGPAKKAEKEQKKRLKKVFFRQNLICSFLLGLTVSSILQFPRYYGFLDRFCLLTFIFDLLFGLFCGKDRSPESSVTRTKPIANNVARIR